MTDVPSTILRAVGILLVLIGLTGTAGSIYALKVLHDYNISSITTSSIKTSISEISKDLETKKEDTDKYIDEVSMEINNASSSVINAGNEVSEASGTIDDAATSTSKSADDLEEGSELNKDAGVYLGKAADSLQDWADEYSDEGSPLPSRYRFDAALDYMRTAATKLESSSAKFKSSSDNMRETSSSLKKTSDNLDDSSEELNKMGKNLNETSNNFEKLKDPLGSLISGVYTTLISSSESIETVAGVASNIRTIAYALVGYLIILHLIILGIGISIIIIEINLFYPGGEE